MHLSDKYRGRENDKVTPAILAEIIKELTDSLWWVKVNGKCYSPDEMKAAPKRFIGLKIGDIKQVDPKLELSRANAILVKLHEKRIDFERRIEKYFQAHHMR